MPVANKQRLQEDGSVYESLLDLANLSMSTADYLLRPAPASGYWLIGGGARGGGTVSVTSFSGGPWEDPFLPAHRPYQQHVQDVPNKRGQYFCIAAVLLGLFRAGRLTGRNLF